MFGKRAILSGVGVVLLSGASSSAVLAQSPYEGSWSGAFSYQSTSTCTSTGPGGTSSYHETCTGTDPWTGSVSANGRLTVFRYTGTSVCTTDVAPSNPNYFSSPGDAAPFSYGVIDAGGTINVPAVTVTRTIGTTTVIGQCPATTFQFTGATMSNAMSCSQTSHDVSAATTDCSGTNTSTWSGTKGLAVLVPPKVLFPMTVSSTVTPASATATAQVSPPASEVGTTGSIYVFAHARQSKLAPALMDRKRTITPSPVAPTDGNAPDPCVLAQLNSNGQLTAASASNLQAYTTGVLSSQGQSVTILNSVPTPNVTGASFFVGYGTTSSSMIAGGTYQGAVSVTGASGCSGALLAGAAPTSPAGLSGLWWNPQESGWGISFTQRRNVIFGAWYTYDSSGKPKWYVASNCALPAGVTATSGTCTGTLYQVSGPTFFGSTFDPGKDNVASVGTLTVVFANANSATMTYSMNGQGRTIPIVRQAFQTGSTPPAVDYTDLWWNPSESGWGMVITQQYGVMFLAWYVYDDRGNPVWYVAPDCIVVGSSCSGTAYGTTGPPLGPTFDPNAVHAIAAGTITVNFQDANNASVSYSVGGTSDTKLITRQTF